MLPSSYDVGGPHQAVYMLSDVKHAHLYESEECSEASPGLRKCLLLAQDPARVSKPFTKESRESMDPEARRAQALLAGLEALRQSPQPLLLSRTQHFARRIKVHTA